MKTTSVLAGLLVPLALVAVDGGSAGAQCSPPVTAVGQLFGGILGGAVGGSCPGNGSPGTTTPAQPTVIQTGTGSSGGSSGGGSGGGSSGGGTTTQPPILNPILCTTAEEFNNPPPGTYCGTNNPTLNPTGAATPTGPGPAGGGPAGGVAVATPPTAGEVWARVPLPQPGCQYNPATTGLTGLATWGWAAPAAPVTATPSMNGYTVVAQAHPTRYIWEWGDGASDASIVPGSAASPAVRHTYRTKDDYTIACRVVWAGSYTFTSPGGAVQTVDLGTTAMRQDFAYHVVEIRSVLVAPPT